MMVRSLVCDRRRQKTAAWADGHNQSCLCAGCAGERRGRSGEYGIAVLMRRHRCALPQQPASCSQRCGAETSSERQRHAPGKWGTTASGSPRWAAAIEHAQTSRANRRARATLVAGLIADASPRVAAHAHGATEIRSQHAGRQPSRRTSRLRHRQALMAASCMVVDEDIYSPCPPSLLIANRLSGFPADAQTARRRTHQRNT